MQALCVISQEFETAVGSATGSAPPATEKTGLRKHLEPAASRTMRLAFDPHFLGALTARDHDFDGAAVGGRAGRANGSELIDEDRGLWAGHAGVEGWRIRQ